MNLPAGSAFGGTVSRVRPETWQAIVERQRSQTGSAAAPATSAKRRPRPASRSTCTSVPRAGGTPTRTASSSSAGAPSPSWFKKRTTPIFAGDTLVDGLPTLDRHRHHCSASAWWSRRPPSRHDADAQRVARHRPARRAGQRGRACPCRCSGSHSTTACSSAASRGSPRPRSARSIPFDDPAGENITLLLLDAHRMIGDASRQNWRKIQPFVKLFQDAFPKEASEAAACG